MTYTLINIPFVIVTAVVTLATLRRPGFGRRMAASGIAAAVLFVLTAVFDSIMIGSDLVRYPEESMSGIRIGLAPIEDFAYAVCAAFLIPAVWTLLTPGGHRAGAEADAR
ncbi:lycopene cyclase domain-containing protein [Microbacterium sp. Marseille-Q6648]|uniref:lycopene cyclase domain-containing protein n=1 Tax=Microbacterium sp. Marseille-Q6648 TaxID=2937991 RepID=UPI00203B3DD1|nr:lycopene cyclase domain-containing protein [Microbacterium sp. Marseille-Q6648]